jgi:hypothetical protein
MREIEPPTHEEIAVAAYYLWLEETASPAYTPEIGEELAQHNWIEAEHHLTRERCGDVDLLPARQVADELRSHIEKQA